MTKNLYHKLKGGIVENIAESVPYSKWTRVIDKEELGEGVFQIVAENPIVHVLPKPGQFFSLKTKEQGTKLLGRPIGVCQIVKNNNLVFWIQAVGEGTKALSRVRLGEKIQLIGPLGNGFSINKDKKALVVGGGIGIAPLVYLIKTLSSFQNSVRTLLGFRNVPYGIESIQAYTKNLTVVSEAGKGHKKGFVTPFLEKDLCSGLYETVYACGPPGLLKEVQRLCRAYNVPVQISIEERMACGVGACLVCACRVNDDKKEAGYHFVRACLEGPVFNGNEVMFDE